MKVINLLPKEEIRQLKLELISGQVIRFWIAVIVSTILLLLAGLATSFYLNQKIVALNLDVDQKQAELNSAETRGLEQEVKSLNDQIQLVQSLRADHYYWSRALIELVYMLDTGSSLTQATLDQQTGQIMVQGKAANRQNVLTFWSNVIKSNMFERINFPLTNLERDIDADFTFTFYIKPEQLKN